MHEKTNNLGSYQVRHRPAQKMVRGLKFWVYKEEELYYPCSENKGADQLCSYCEADQRLRFRLCRLLFFPCGCSFSFNVLSLITCITPSKHTKLILDAQLVSDFKRKHLFFVPRLFEEKRRDIVFGFPSFRPPIGVCTLCAQLLLQFYSDSFETLQMSSSCFEDVHVVWI